MRTWHHSHNLKQSTRDRLDGVVTELRAERSRFEGDRTLTSDEEAERQRVDKALHLVEAAVQVLSH